MEAVAVIHQKLYQRGTDSNINVSSYLTELTHKLTMSFGYSERDLQLDLDTENLILDIERATPLGLIINELVTNSLKHAFEDVEHPRLSISLQKQATEICLSVSDNGIGLPADLDVKKSNSFGLKLINLLTEELNGHLEMTNENGSHWKIVFPA